MLRVRSGDTVSPPNLWTISAAQGVLALVDLLLKLVVLGKKVTAASTFTGFCPEKTSLYRSLTNSQEGFTMA